MLSFKKSELVKVYPEEGVKYFALIDGLERGHLMCRVEIVDHEAYWNERKRPVVISGYTGYDIGLCGGEGKELGCSGYSVRLERVEDIPKNERGVFAGVTNVGFGELNSDIIMGLPVTAENEFIIDAKKGERVIIAVPFDGEEAKKDDGFGGKIPFSSIISGENGMAMYVDGVLYRIYGELCLVDGVYKIYIG